MTSRPAESAMYADLGVCACGMATWFRFPAYVENPAPGKWFCQGCRRLHPVEGSS